MMMQPVQSTNVHSVGYEPSTRVLRVQFLDGAVYDYSDVPRSLFKEMLRPRPWARVGGIVKTYPAVKVA